MKISEPQNSRVTDAELCSRVSSYSHSIQLHSSWFFTLYISSLSLTAEVLLTAGFKVTYPKELTKTDVIAFALRPVRFSVPWPENAAPQEETVQSLLLSGLLAPP